MSCDGHEALPEEEGKGREEGLPQGGGREQEGVPGPQLGGGAGPTVCL